MEGGAVSEAGLGSCRSDWISTRSQWGLSGGIMLSRRLHNLRLLWKTEANVSLSLRRFLSLSLALSASVTLILIHPADARQVREGSERMCVCVCVWVCVKRGTE